VTEPAVNDELEPDVPDNVRELASACGLAVAGWDSFDDTALVHGPDVNYIGTKAEVVAYLTAWQQCQQIKITRQMVEAEQAAGVSYGFIAWNTYQLVEPGQTAQITARPQSRSFRGDRIAIPDDIAARFAIADIKVGNKSMFLQSGDVPASSFSMRIADSTPLFKLTERHGDGPHELVMTTPARLEFGRAMSFAVCNTAQDLSVIVINTSSEPSVFRALVLGKYPR